MMENKNISEKNLMVVVVKLTNIIIALLLVIIVLIVLLGIYAPKFKSANKSVVIAPTPDANGNFTEAAKQAALQPKDTTHYWMAPDMNTINSQANKDMITYGRELIVNTSAYFGENGKIFKSGSNGMNCQNCHLEAGTKVFGNNYSAVASTFPKYRARSGAIENMYKRINDCFERSLNGRAIDTASKEMQSIVAYMKWLGKDVPRGTKPAGSGFKDLAFLDRAAEPEMGKLVYTEKCQSCHQQNGEGLMNGDKTAFTYPPLWGARSYNDGAGLYRLSNFAKFVKYNMPLGASHTGSQLSNEEAWDLAAYVNTQARPKKDIKSDWPNMEEKPFDHPFGPYADGFDEKQHKFGPFAPIKQKLANLKKPSQAKSDGKKNKVS